MLGTDRSAPEPTEHETVAEKSQFLQGLKTRGRGFLLSLPNWKRAIVLGAIAAAAVFLTNFGFIIWAVLHTNVDGS